MARIHFAPWVRLVVFDRTISPSLVGSTVTKEALQGANVVGRKIRKSPAVIARKKAS